MKQQATLREILQKHIDTKKPFVLALYNKKTDQKLEEGFKVFDAMAEVIDDKPLKFKEIEEVLCAEFSVEYLKELLKKAEEMSDVLS